MWMAWAASSDFSSIVHVFGQSDDGYSNGDDDVDAMDDVNGMDDVNLHGRHEHMNVNVILNVWVMIVWSFSDVWVMF